ncbi:MAG TPA: hypothetical protein VFN01_17260 [Marinobacter sp.]|uniref:hypothetical protein n=1 Tax=Marinobacter sp. TaxID=50741 RepID=UPI002D7E16A0|nr:hypothetical protein [Marinobacter sp.]HET8802920.1 hypothetical protein [Marinobacter sp.]
MNVVFRLLLTFNATSLLLVVFLVQNGCSVGCVLQNFGLGFDVSKIVSYIVYSAMPVFLTAFSVGLSDRLGSDEFKPGEISSIEYANNSFLPSYLGYFFVALSVSGWESLFFVYSVLFVFTFLSQALYFNPLFLVFGYNFYNVRTNSGVYIFLISREKYKNPDDVVISKAYRINDYTFIERGDVWTTYWEK